MSAQAHRQERLPHVQTCDWVIDGRDDLDTQCIKTSIVGHVDMRSYGPQGPFEERLYYCADHIGTARLDAFRGVAENAVRALLDEASIELGGAISALTQAASLAERYDAPQSLRVQLNGHTVPTLNRLLNDGTVLGSLEALQLALAQEVGP